MVQSLNLQGILAVGQVLRNPSMMLPHVSIKHIGLLDFELLRQAGTLHGGEGEREGEMERWQAEEVVEMYKVGVLVAVS